MKKWLLVAGIAAIATGLWVVFPAVRPASLETDSASTLEAAPQAELETGDVNAPAREPARASTAVVPVEGASLITGHVFDLPVGGDSADREAAIGAEVQLSSFLTGLGGDPLPTTRTDESGAFRLEVRHDWEGKRRFTLLASSDGSHGHARHELSLQAGDPDVISVALERYAHAPLTGIVVDLEERAIPLVTVRVVGMRDERGRAVSDEHGRFEIPSLEHGGDIKAEKSGWVAFDSPSAKHGERGTWQEARVVMDRAGSLRVVVEDMQEGSVPGLDVLVSLAAAGTLGSEREFASESQRAKTDRDGAAWFSEIWAGQKLRVHIMTAGTAVWMEREADGFLQHGRAQVGRPIVVEPGGERTVRVRFAQLTRITGLVLGPDDAPYPNAHIRLVSGQDIYGAPDFVNMPARSNAEGRFELELAAYAPVGLALLTASNAREHFFHWEEGASPFAAFVKLDLTDPPTEPIVLRLEPTLEIAGMLTDARGEALRGEVLVTPVEGELIAGRVLTGFRSAVRTKADGSFLVAGLLAGRYDLVATHPKYARVQRAGIAAGTSGLIVRMEDEPAAQVEIVVDTGDVEVQEVIVLHGTLTPDEGSEPDAPLLAAERTYEAPFGWPESALGLWYGAQGTKTERGHCSFSSWPVKEASKSIGMDPGWYWFGAKARTASGGKLFPIGTGLVRVAAGSHRLVFRLHPSGAVGGSVQGADDTGLDLYVALATHRGELIPLDVRRNELGTMLELGAQGTFLFNQVPEGELELRVGTRAQLSAGEARARRAIVVRADSPLDLSIEL